MADKQKKSSMSGLPPNVPVAPPAIVNIYKRILDGDKKEEKDKPDAGSAEVQNFAEGGFVDTVKDVIVDPIANIASDTFASSVPLLKGAADAAGSAATNFFNSAADWDPAWNIAGAVPLVLREGSILARNAGILPPRDPVQAEQPTEAPLGPDQAVPADDTVVALAPEQPFLVPQDGSGGVSGGVGVSSSASGTSVPTPNKPQEIEENEAFREAERMKVESAQAMADSESYAASEVSRLQEEGARIAQERQAAYEQTKAELFGQVDQINKDIVESKINPNRIYHNMSTGQRVSAVAAIIMGGLADTLVGIRRGGPQGKNIALAMLERAAANDVDAQKADLANKQSVVQSLLQKGHSIDAAEKIAYGMSMDVIASQLKAIEATRKGDMAQAGLGAIAAQAKIEAEKNIAEGVKISIDNAYAPLVYESQLATAQAQRWQISEAVKLQREQAAAQSQATVTDAEFEAAFERAQERRATDADYRRLYMHPKGGKALKESMMRMPDGKSWALAQGGGESTGKARERLAEMANYNSILRDIRDVAVENKKAIDRGMKLPFTKWPIDTLMVSALIAKVKASNLGAYDKGVAELMERLMASNPRDITQNLDNTLAQIDQMIKLGEREANIVLDSSLAGSSTLAPKSLGKGRPVAGE